jgi:hypothetical protein
MPLAGFEPTIPVFKWGKTFHALVRAATVTGQLYIYLTKYGIYILSRISKSYEIGRYKAIYRSIQFTSLQPIP